MYTKIVQMHIKSGASTMLLTYAEIQALTGTSITPKQLSRKREIIVCGFVVKKVFHRQRCALLVRREK